MGMGSSLGPKDNEKRTKLAHAKGQGSSYRGSHEWLISRINAVLSIIPSIYVVICLIVGNASSYEAFSLWLGNVFNSAMLIFAIVTLCWHGALGVITVINDYIHNSGVNFTLTLFVKAFFSLVVLMCVLSILKVLL